MTFNAPSKYFTRLISLQIPTSTLILRHRAKNFVILGLLIGVSSTTRSWYLARFLKVLCSYLPSPDEIQTLPSKLDKFSRALESLILRKAARRTTRMQARMRAGRPSTRLRSIQKTANEALKPSTIRFNFEFSCSTASVIFYSSMHHRSQ